MKIKAVLYTVAVLMPMAASAAEYKDAAGAIPGLDSGIAAEQLQSFSPDGGGMNGFTPAPPPAPEPAAERMFSENDPLHKRLAETLGIGYPCTVESKRIGASYQTTRKVTLDDGNKKETVIVKFAKTGEMDKFSGFMWKTYMEVMSLHKIGETGNPVKILKNGIVMNRKFKDAGFNVLDLILADTENMVIATKFLKGTEMDSVLRAVAGGDASALRAMENLGSALAAVHGKDLYIGDLNSGNVMFVGEEPYFIDLDRAGTGGAKGWDIAAAFYYPILTGKAEPQTWSADAARAFLKGYLAGGGDKKVIKDALSARYLAPVSVLMRSKHLDPIRAVRHEMKMAAGENSSRESDKALDLV